MHGLALRGCKHFPLGTRNYTSVCFPNDKAVGETNSVEFGSVQEKWSMPTAVRIVNICFVTSTRILEILLMEVIDQSIRQPQSRLSTAS